MSLENSTASDQGGIAQWTTGTERKLGREGLSHETFWGNKIAPGTLELDPLERAWVRGRSAELYKLTDITIVYGSYYMLLNLLRIEIQS